MQAASNLPYHAYAWSHVSFRGRNLCLRLASTRPEDYDSFVPAEGVTRDFRLQLSGEIEAHSGDYFGAEMRLFVPSTPEGQKLEVALVPDGPLLDGSAGQTIVLDGAELLPQGIPIGVYKASAAFVAPSGARTPLEVSFTDRDDYASETTVQFESTDSCVGSTASGPDRAFLWIRVPGGE